MQLVTTVTTKGQVVIPKPIRDRFLIKPFDRVEFVIRGANLVLKKAATIEEMYGFIKTKKRFTDEELEREIKRAVSEGVAQNYEKKQRSGRI